MHSFKAQRQPSGEVGPALQLSRAGTWGPFELTESQWGLQRLQELPCCLVICQFFEELCPERKGPLTLGSIQTGQGDGNQAQEHRDEVSLPLLLG